MFFLYASNGTDIYKNFGPGISSNEMSLLNDFAMNVDVTEPLCVDEVNQHNENACESPVPVEEDEPEDPIARFFRTTDALCEEMWIKRNGQLWQRRGVGLLTTNVDVKDHGEWGPEIRDGTPYNPTIKLGSYFGQMERMKNDNSEDESSSEASEDNGTSSDPDESSSEDESA